MEFFASPTYLAYAVDFLKKIFFFVKHHFTQEGDFIKYLSLEKKVSYIEEIINQCDLCIFPKLSKYNSEKSSCQTRSQIKNQIESLQYSRPFVLFNTVFTFSKGGKGMILILPLLTWT